MNKLYMVLVALVAAFALIGCGVSNAATKKYEKRVESPCALPKPQQGVVCDGYYMNP